MNDPIVQVLIAVLPSVVVFLTAFYLLKQTMSDRSAERIAAVRKDDHKVALPLRLQAYERMALFLERIQPGPLVLRMHQGSMDTRDLQHTLVATIREEYEHNVTQQIYVSDRAWAKVKQAKDETIRLIHLSFEAVGEHPSGSELSRKIFENTARLSHTPSQEALVVIKDEVRRLF